MWLHNADNFTVGNGSLRIDLRSQKMISKYRDATGLWDSSTPYTLKATGLDVFYTGATSGNNAKIAVGGGTFTFVNDKRTVTSAVSLTNTTTATEATNGWGTAPTYGGSANARTLGGLTITGSNDTAIQGLGVVYGGTVTIDGVSSSAASNLRYIEGTGVAVGGGASSFSGNLTLVGSGAGIIEYVTSLTAGIAISANLTTSNGGNLSLHQTGSVNGYGGYGILVSFATLTAGGALRLNQSGSATEDGIYVNFSSLIAGSELSLVQGGTVGRGSMGIRLEAWSADANEAVTLSAGTGQFVTLKTNGNNVTHYNFTVTSGKVRIDLGSGALTGGKTLKATGLDVYFSGATTGNNATIAVGSGSFTFVNNRRHVTAAVTLNNSTTASDATNGWGAAPVFDILGNDTTLGGLTISGTGGAARLQGLGVVYGGAVTIQGVTAASTTGVNNLRYIEGTGIEVLAPAGQTAAAGGSTFSGSLTLVSNGAGVPVTIDGAVYYEGVAINRANLTTSNGGDLILTQTGSVADTGIYIKQSTVSAAGAMTLTQSGAAVREGIKTFNATLTAGTAMSLTSSANAGWGAVDIYGSTLRAGTTMSLTQSGSAGKYGIAVYSSTLTSVGSMSWSQTGTAAYDGILASILSLTAGGDLSLLQTGTIGSTYGGITLQALGTASGQGVTLAAESNNFVTLKTNNQGLALNTNDNFTVTSGRVRIDLGTGVMVSSTPASPFTLKATGLDVYFTGATTGNSAKIAVGSGSFTFVNDKRTVTSAVSLTNTTTATEATNGWGAAPTYGGVANARTLGGLTITGSNDTAIQGLGVVYGGTVSISGVSSGAARNLTYIEGTSITTSGTSAFAGGLQLVASGSGGLTLGGNLTLGGALRLYASTLRLTSNFTTAGGAVTINLGAGVYNSGGYIFNTSNQNLSATMGSVVATDNQTVFEVGTGTITVPTGLRATVVLGSTKYWDFDPEAAGQ